jgi:hypothetical protein
MSVAGFARNKPASVLHTAIDRACSAAKPIFFQLTAGEIVPEASKTPKQLQINSKLFDLPLVKHVSRVIL